MATVFGGVRTASFTPGSRGFGTGARGFGGGMGAQVSRGPQGASRAFGNLRQRATIGQTPAGNPRVTLDEGEGFSVSVNPAGQVVISVEPGADVSPEPKPATQPGPKPAAAA